MSTVRKKPLVTIIIPTYNEEADIRRTLSAVVNLKYPHKEIIVVDDSTDDTPNIIREYEKYGVKMLRQKINKGRCGARNLGILEAKGEIVVLLNADVFPESDFIDRILAHYEKGADYVLVESKVANDEYLFPRFLGAQHRFEYADQDWIEWTEGFSCRKQAAIDVGMFLADFPIPLCAGEDGFFGKKLREKYKKVIDRSITVYHVVPHTLRDYWAQQKGRGEGTPLFKFFVDKMPLTLLIMRTLLKTIYIITEIVLIIPGIFNSFQLSRFSLRRLKDLIPFWYAYIIQRLALIVGGWEGLMKIVKINKEAKI